MRRKMPIAALMVVAIGTMVSASAASYHVDSQTGSDTNDGRSPQTAWATLNKASGMTYEKGDRILLKRGCVFKGKLELTGATGTEDAPVSIEAYGDGDTPPKINSAGYIAGILIEGSDYVAVKNVDMTSDGGQEIDKAARTDRNGMYVLKSRHVSISGLRISSIYATIQTQSEGKDLTTAYGHGVRLVDSESLTVSNCKIERTGRYGIQATRSQNIEILNNRTDHTGCSGVQMSRCKDIVIRGNRFDHPGSFIDERMHGRGSGSWVWTCENVLYEKNEFLNARGKGDSCGVHIDFNCKNVVVQHCFSMNNEGGFIEILGNNLNCAYRYNISVNDGFRKKGQDGAHQEGKVLWLSGYCGAKQPRHGPFNSYIYNNTVYVKAGERACFSIAPTTRGVLIANNIFHLLGHTADVLGDQEKPKGKPKNVTIANTVFTNNLYIHDAIIPASLGIKDSHPIIGDSGFKTPGGETPEDYMPANVDMLRDKGITITRLPGDTIGLTIGLEVTHDFFGNAIKGPPDIGAIELQ
jgi:hypothetical protein